MNPSALTQTAAAAVERMLDEHLDPLQAAADIVMEAGCDAATACRYALVALLRKRPELVEDAWFSTAARAGASR